MAAEVTERQVRELLNNVIDPCSAAAGAPAGLDDMGLVRAVDIEPGPDGVRVRVALAITEPGCLMGLPFQATAYEQLLGLDGVARVDVTLDPDVEWSEADLSPEYARRLAEVRSSRREKLHQLGHRLPAQGGPGPVPVRLSQRVGE
ncbi:iron-sulfur cluster assembly protein [Streptomyces sp. NPDC006872]|uniref:metal-sulfur cluster assembly factor n=1 Tax=Streptomyces sp. NPDC006872 TaxID=3155720 RepID=UPI0033EAC14A